MNLLTDQATDKSGEWFGWPGGFPKIFSSGTFGGASVQLQAKFSAELTLGEPITETGIFCANCDLPPSCQIRAILSSAGASTDVTIEVG